MALAQVVRTLRLDRSFTYGGSGGIHPCQLCRETHGSRMSIVMERVEVDLRRKAGSVPKSGRPEGSRLDREG